MRLESFPSEAGEQVTESRDSASNRRGIAPVAIAASVLLHGLTFAVVAAVAFRQSAEPVAVLPSLQSMAITLVKKPAGTDAVTVSGRAKTVPIPEQEATAVAPEALEGEPGSAAFVAEDVTAELPRSDADSTRAYDGIDRNRVMAMVATGIAGYRAANRDSLIEQFTQTCTRFRHRYGQHRACPGVDSEQLGINSREKALAEEVFAVVTRDADQARLSRQLEKEETFLQEVMKSEGPAAEQARIRWQLNRQYHAFLNDNIHPQLTLMAQTAMINDYNRTITPAPFQFLCKDGPCVYKYTGFEVKRPANYVEQEPSLVIKPPLFPVAD